MGELVGQKQDSPESQENKGIKVVVDNPRFIYSLLRFRDQDEKGSVSINIQHDQINDSVISVLTTNAEVCSLTSKLRMGGRGASIRRFTKGYVTDQQQEDFAQFILKNDGFDGVVFHRNDRGIMFNYGGNTYSVGLGFFDLESKRKWLDEKIEEEKNSIHKSKAYMESRGVFSGDQNKDITLTNIYHESDGRPDDPARNFEEDLGKYAKVYEVVLRGIYKMYGQEEPNKVLTLGYKTTKEDRRKNLKVVK